MKILYLFFTYQVYFTIKYIVKDLFVERSPRAIFLTIILPFFNIFLGSFLITCHFLTSLKFGGIFVVCLGLLGLFFNKSDKEILSIIENTEKNIIDRVKQAVKIYYIITSISIIFFLFVVFSDFSFCLFN